jgi:dCTP deaminase
MVPYEVKMGEFRVHYAGFFDPGFGSSELLGPNKSKAVLEVRCHETPFILEDNQVIGKLLYELLTEEPETVYGKSIKSNYQGQDLKLSKHFLH